MLTDKQLRNQIMNRIQRIRGNNLSELNEFVKQIEASIGNKEKILSFGGSFKSMDNEVFEELTKNL